MLVVSAGFWWFDWFACLCWDVLVGCCLNTESLAGWCLVVSLFVLLCFMVWCCADCFRMWAFGGLLLLLLFVFAVVSG